MENIRINVSQRNDRPGRIRGLRYFRDDLAAGRSQTAQQIQNTVIP